MAAPPPAAAAAAAALAAEELASPAGRLRGARLLMDAIYGAYDPKAGRAEDWVPKGYTAQSARCAGRSALSSSSQRRAPRRRRRPPPRAARRIVRSYLWTDAHG
jgi:hypothetical protein